MKPRVYLAGKIGKNDWRHQVVPGLRGAVSNSNAGQILNPRFEIDCGRFIYAGPFFIACDHGGFHGPSTHGIGTDMGPGSGCCELPLETIGYKHAGEANAFRDDVFAVNWQRVARSDILFAYIEEPTAFGTLVEIGQAFGLDKRIAIAFPDRKWVDDFWYAAKAADLGQVYRGSFPTVWAEFIHWLAQAPPTQQHRHTSKRASAQWP